MMQIDKKNDERSLIEAIISGDRRAMKDLYGRYSGYAMSVCRRYVADDEGVKDVMQDVFVSVLTHIKDFEYRNDGALKAWITRIAVNRSLDYIKENNLLTSIDENMNLPDEEPDVNGVSMYVIQKMIEQLPTDLRVVFNLYVLEDKTHQEIASMLNINTSSSVRRFQKARNLLAKMIHDYKEREI